MTNAPETPTTEPRKPDWVGASIRKMEQERKEFLAELEAETGHPIPEDLADFLI